MRLRRVSPPQIVKPLINATKAGIVEQYGITTAKLEGHYLARGNVGRVISALIAATTALTASSASVSTLICDNVEATATASNTQAIAPQRSQCSQVSSRMGVSRKTACMHSDRSDRPPSITPGAAGQ